MLNSSYYEESQVESQSDRGKAGCAGIWCLYKIKRPEIKGYALQNHFKNRLTQKSFYIYQIGGF